MCSSDLSAGKFVRNQSATRKGPAEKGKPLKPLRAPVTSEGRKVSQLEKAVKSVSGAFVIRQKKNVYWGKIRRNHERVVTDLAGNPLRRLNYRSPSVPLTNRDTIPNRINTTKRDTPWSSTKVPGFKTATRSGTAWQGDISGKQIGRAHV